MRRALALIALFAATAATAQPVVRAPAGAVRGVAANGEHVFKGLPYALAPIGARRWKAPAPMAPWRGVRDGSQFGHPCQQPQSPAGSIYTEPYPGMSEDCLTLNIWAPAYAKNAPVFVWVHGGSLMRGASSQPMYDGAALAKRGIVVVSVNYRLGVFGWFAHPELSAESPEGVSGNYGTLDQIAALRWVKRNIGAFGGDAKRVTIAGESAGGLSMLYLLASPKARGLFAQAIVQSASLMNIPELKQAAHGLPSAELAGAHLSGGKSLAELRAMDSAAITEFARTGHFAASGVVDGKVLPRQLIETFERGEQAHVPILTGFNSGEIATMRPLLPGVPDPAQYDAAKYEAAIRDKYGALADDFLRFYPASDIGRSILTATRDAFFAWTSQSLVRDQAKIGQPAYLYFFDHGYPAADDAGIRGFHASEVPFMFGNIDRVTALWPAIPQTPAERGLSDAMADYWAAFVKTGKPVAAGHPAWPSYNKNEGYMAFTDAPHPSAHLLSGQFRLHDAVVCRRRAAGTIPWNWNTGVAAPSLPPATEQCK